MAAKTTHLIVVCASEGAHIFSYDDEECSQEELTSVGMRRRNDHVRKNYEQLAIDLIVAACDHARLDCPVTLACTSSFDTAQRKIIADALQRSGFCIGVQCTVTAGGQAGFNQVLREHLPTADRIVDEPSPRTAYDPPPRGKTKPAGAWMAGASSAVTSIIARVR